MPNSQALCSPEGTRKKALMLTFVSVKSWNGWSLDEPSRRRLHRLIGDRRVSVRQIEDGRRNRRRCVGLRPLGRRIIEQGGWIKEGSLNYRGCVAVRNGGQTHAAGGHRRKNLLLVRAFSKLGRLLLKASLLVRRCDSSQAVVFRCAEQQRLAMSIAIILTAGNEALTAQSLDEFKSHLESLLRSPRTKQVVEAIKAQATALGAIDADQ